MGNGPIRGKYPRPDRDPYGAVDIVVPVVLPYHGLYGAREQSYTNKDLIVPSPQRGGGIVE